MAKRPREPDEAPKQTDKHPRLLKKKKTSNPEPPRDLQKGNEEKPGRPEPSSHAASQLQLPQPNPIQLPSQQPQFDHEWSDSETSTCYSKDVAAYDVRQDDEVDEIPRAEDNEYWGSFIRSRSGLDGNWVGVRPLGEGGNGIAGLWELRDDDGQTVKQMVVKEESHKMKMWTEHKDVREVPAEVKVMSKLNKAKCHAITRLFNYKRYPQVYKHRIYMEFCPHNDLDRLIKRYSRFRQFLPEAFLWDTFYHLVEAAVAMKSGTGDWEFEIVHGDLKPANVFLGAENAKKGFPFYPVAKLGDFGHGVLTNHEDAGNPSRLRGYGTPGYFAPEQILDDTPEESQYRLSTYTNIWAIGAIMLELVTLYRHADYMATEEYHVNGQIVDIKTVRKPEYTEELRKLIKQCVAPHPLKRIKLEDLRSRIKSRRHEYRKLYREKSKGQRERFRADHRLYYVGNEINDMPTGNWEPKQANGSPRSESDGFDREFPVKYPRFADGPEGESDHEAALPHKDREGKGHRFSKPIVISDDDPAKKSNDGSDVWRRNERRPRPIKKDESFSDGRRLLDKDLDVARGRGGVRDDDNDGASDDGEKDMDLEVEEPPSPLPPDDEEVDMDLEVEEPPSPPPPEDLVQFEGYTSAPTTQAERRAVAHFALHVQSPTPPPAQVQAQPQPPAPAPAAPAAPPQTAHAALPPAPLQPQALAPAPPPPPPAPKSLRNGKVRGFYG